MRNPHRLTSATVIASIAIVSIVLLAACATGSEQVESHSTASTASTVAFPLPDTGQTTSYTATAGEDADTAINPPSYTDNGDGTVTDNVTGLMWQQYDGGEMTHADAVAYCAGLSLGGHSDWRLPTAHELFSINYLGAISPALDTSVFTQDYTTLYGADYVRELYWWSGDQRSDTDSRAWVTNAGGGIGAHQKAETHSYASGPGSDGKTRYFHVRAVRNVTTPDLPSSHFTDNGDGTVTDNFTGLVWQQAVSSSTYTWEDALGFVNTLNTTGGFAGKTDWRLPNIRELFSLVDVAKMSPCIDGSTFDVTSLDPYAEPANPSVPGALWSSTSMYVGPPGVEEAWDLHDLYSGIISYSLKTATEHILCVRGGQ